MTDIWKMTDLEYIFQSEGITEEKVKAWSRIASGPEREHVGTDAEREHWENTYLKQTTAGGADTQATTKHPNLPDAKEWHREHFCRQGNDTSIQPQTSSSQARLEWQDWSGWQVWTVSGSSSKKMLKEERTNCFPTPRNGRPPLAVARLERSVMWLSFKLFIKNMVQEERHFPSPRNGRPVHSRPRT